MSDIIFYRGDDRSYDEIRQSDGFKPYNKEYRNRTIKDAHDYIINICKNPEFSKSVDFSRYIISSSKGDSVSCSRIREGASYGRNKYKIILSNEDIYYFDFEDGGKIGKLITYEDTLLKNIKKSCYYILSSKNIDESKFLIVGTKTPTQEVTFFTDIPNTFISEA